MRARSSLAVSPITLGILAAREFQRGTLQLIDIIAPYRYLGIQPPPLHLLLNRVLAVSSNATLVQQTLRLIFREHREVRILGSELSAIEAFFQAATAGQAEHWLEYRRPSERPAPAALGSCAP